MWLPRLRPSQGFRGFREKGYLFSGIWGEGSFIFMDLGLKHNFLTFWGFREQGERSFFFQRAKTPGGGGGSRFFFFFAGVFSWGGGDWLSAFRWGKYP